MKQWTGTVLLLSSIALVGNSQNHFTIINGVTKKMTGYKFCGITYYPDRLAISLNGKPMEEGTFVEIPDTSKTINVRYDYSFAKGFRKGAKEICFELCPKKKSYLLNFSWYNHDRIIAEGAKLKEVKRDKYRT